MFKINAAAFTGILFAAILLQGCSRQVTRVSENKQIDISGRWNNTDSRLVAEEMIQNVLSENWLSDFLQKQGKKPVVIVGMVSNKTHEHIDAETFIKDMERAFITTQKVRLVQSGAKREELRGERADQQKNASVSTMKKWGLEIGADYILQGSINSIVDSHKRRMVTYYQVDLELTDLQSNEVVWIGNKKIAKYIKN